MFSLTTSCTILRLALFTFFISCSFITLAQNNALQQNMQLNFDGQGAYEFGSLGKYGNQEGGYHIDVQGHVKFQGPLGNMKFSYKYEGNLYHCREYHCL